MNTSHQVGVGKLPLPAETAHWFVFSFFSFFFFLFLPPLRQSQCMPGLQVYAVKLGLFKNKNHSVRACMPWHTCRDQRAAYWSWISPIMLVLGMDLRSSGLTEAPLPTEPSSQLVVLFVLFFQDRVSRCSPGCPGTHFINQTGLELPEIQRSAPLSLRLLFRVLGLKVCSTTAQGQLVCLFH